MVVLSVWSRLMFGTCRNRIAAGVVTTSEEASKGKEEQGLKRQKTSTKVCHCFIRDEFTSCHLGYQKVTRRYHNVPASNE